MKRVRHRRPGGRAHGLALLVVLGLCAGAAVAAYAGSGLPSFMNVFAASGATAEAPDFVLPDIEGGTVTLTDYRGRQPVLLYFWATWCPSCRAARPDLIKLRERTRSEDLAMLAINVGSGDSLEKVQRYQQAHPLPLKVLYDTEGRVAQTYGVQGIPLFVLIDRNGKVVYRDHQLPQDLNPYLAPRK